MGKSRNHWTKERIFAEAKKYQSKSEFKKVCTSAYQTARVNGWLSEMSWFKHIKCTQKTKNSAA